MGGGRCRCWAENRAEQFCVGFIFASTQLSCDEFDVISEFGSGQMKDSSIKRRQSAFVVDGQAEKVGIGDLPVPADIRFE